MRSFRDLNADNCDCGSCSSNVTIFSFSLQFEFENFYIGNSRISTFNFENVSFDFDSDKLVLRRGEKINEMIQGKINIFLLLYLFFLFLKNKTKHNRIETFSINPRSEIFE